MTITFTDIKLGSTALMFFSQLPGSVDPSTGDELVNLRLVFLTENATNQFLNEVMAFACDETPIVRYISDDGDTGLNIAFNPQRASFNITM